MLTTREEETTAQEAEADPRDTRINMRSKPATNAVNASESERDVGRATSVEATALMAQEYFNSHLYESVEFV